MNSILYLFFGLITLPGVFCNERILLEKLKVVTLHEGRLTNARRTSPIPQLRCVGGTAGCSAFVPKVVQCINQGSDGYDVQWECKTDMSNRYRFGRIQVNCEGYDYPNDPYVLRGSCGLEYTLDVTKEGRRKSSGGGYGHGSTKGHQGAGLMGNLLPVVIVCGAIYFIYTTCLAPAARRRDAQPEEHDYRDPPPPYPGTAGGSYGSTPPPPGFRPEYVPDDCDTRYRASAPPHSGSEAQNSGPGFWSGAALGGVMGYLFGSGGQRERYDRTYYSSGYDSSCYDSSRPRERLYPDVSGYRDSDSGSEGGTRTASGFGGTSRR